MDVYFCFLPAPEVSSSPSSAIHWLSATRSIDQLKIMDYMKNNTDSNYYFDVFVLFFNLMDYEHPAPLPHCLIFYDEEYRN